MFKKFEMFFNMARNNAFITENRQVTILQVFLESYQGVDFGNGLYRVFTNKEISKWKEIIADAYPEFKGGFEPFSYDWLGRCFAVDTRNESENKNKILMFEIGTGDVLEIPCDFMDFHNEEIPMYGDACLATTFFADWKKSSNHTLKHNQCAGYKIPLFLGGKDTIENLEVSDMEVYWYICSSAKNRK